MGNTSAELQILVGAAEEVDDLGQLRLRLVDPGDVGERDTIARGLVAASSRAAERTEHVLHVAGPPHQPEQQADEEDRRSETEQQVLPPGRAGVERHRVLDNALALEKLRERVRVCESGDLGREARGRLRAAVALLLRERSLDRCALRRDLGNATRSNLLEEERAVRDAHSRLRLGRARADPEIEREQHEREEDPTPTESEARPLRGSRRRARRRPR